MNTPAENQGKQAAHSAEGAPSQELMSREERWFGKKANTVAERSSQPSPEEKENERPTTVAERLFRDSTVRDLGKTINGSLQRLADHTGANLEAVEQSRNAFAEIAYDLKLSPTEAQRVHGDYVQHVTKPPSEEQVAAWARETRKAVRDRYGDQAEERLKVARDYVAKNPFLAQALDHTGLGSDPNTVLMLIEKSWGRR